MPDDFVEGAVDRSSWAATNGVTPPGHGEHWAGVQEMALFQDVTIKDSLVPMIALMIGTLKRVIQGIGQHMDLNLTPTTCRWFAAFGIFLDLI